MRVIAHLDTDVVVVEIRPPAPGELAGEQPAVLVDLSQDRAEALIAFGSIVSHSNGYILDGAPEGLSADDLARALRLAQVAVERSA